MITPESVRLEVGKIARWEEAQHRRTKKRVAFLRALCEAALDGTFEKALQEGESEKDFGEACYEKLTSNGRGGASHLLASVIRMLDQYEEEYKEAPTSNDSVVIRFQRGLYRPEFKLGSEAATEPSPALDVHADRQFRLHNGFPLPEIERLIGTCKRFRASAVWVPHLNTLAPKLKVALAAGAEVTFLLSHPDSPFARIRGASLTSDPDKGRREIIDNRNVLRDLRELLSPKHLALRLTPDCFPTSYLEIDDRVYFSALWFKRASVDGWWASTGRNTRVGEYFADQFDELFQAAVTDDLKGNPFPTTPRHDTFLPTFAESEWFGTMKEVGREDHAALRPDDEHVVFRVSARDTSGEVKGSMEIRTAHGTVNLVLRNGLLRDRHIAFTCEDKDPVVSRAGTLLLGLDEENPKLSGYYTGWSKRQDTRYTCRLDLTRSIAQAAKP